MAKMLCLVYILHTYMFYVLIPSKILKENLIFQKLEFTHYQWGGVFGGSAPCLNGKEKKFLPHFRSINTTSGSKNKKKC